MSTTATVWAWIAGIVALLVIGWVVWMANTPAVSTDNSTDNTIIVQPVSTGTATSTATSTK